MGTNLHSKSVNTNLHSKSVNTNKINKKKTKNVSVLPTVSILTISQIKRQETILLTAQHINNQGYKNIIEWVIVEGSKTLEECLTNEQFIKNELKCVVPIVYVPGYHLENDIKIFNGNHLGELRNISNKNSKGEICVCMDDDDIYPKTRVEHAVQMLMGTKAEIAGCSSKYLYDYSLQRLFRFKQFGLNHSTNDCFAYKRCYFEKNSYDSSKDMAEESSFTKNFTNPMVQLEPKHTIIGSSHTYNTFNKREICTFSCLWMNPSNPSEGYMYPQTVDITETVEDLVGKELVEKYTSIFNKNETSEFDISYFCGGTSIEWDPTSQSLGGSEQAVVHICSEWVKMGKKVAVYAKIKSEIVYNGIHFMDWKIFPFHKQHKVVVLWRMAGINCGLLFPIKTKKLFVDYHDNNFVFRHPYLPYINKIDKIFFKSDFHLEYYESHFKMKVEKERYAIIPNGLRISDFSENPGVTREPFRFCYCSCYTRGLVELLQYVWPIIYANFPQAELHTYYGMDQLEPQSRQHLMMLLGQPGVMDHGRRPMKEIVLEKWRSSFHLYITECQGEIDCISIRESLVTGCIPLISKSNVFANREGLHFDLERTPEGYQKIAHGICNLLTKPEFVEMCRQKFKMSSTIMNWKTIAEQWLEYF
jgi:glycosyltransferase involved in cell wall biosynthesis